MRSPFLSIHRGFGILPNKQFCSFGAAAAKGKIRKCGYTSYACYVSFSTPYNNGKAEMPNVPNKKKNAANLTGCNVFHFRYFVFAGA